MPCHSPTAIQVEHLTGIEFGSPPTARTRVVEPHARALELPLLVRPIALFSVV